MLLVGQAQAHLDRIKAGTNTSVLKNRIKHSEHVIRFFENHPRLINEWPTKKKAKRILTQHVKMYRWNTKRIEALTIPIGEAQLRAYINDDCLEDIIEWETGGTWDVTIDYGFGHGNVYEAYGLPQAKPGTKMSSAGSDWRTNPKTQIRWMRNYVNERYGSSCNARAFKINNGWY